MYHQEMPNDYDTEPVRFCAKCYSLKVKYDESIDSEYCDECGCTDILEDSIDRWEERYERRYGRKFTQKQEDPKKTYIFKLSIRELKDRVYDSERWKEIIHTIYPKFPGGLGKADSVILFFDTLIRKNQLDDLRLYLFKNYKH